VHLPRIALIALVVAVMGACQGPPAGQSPGASQLGDEPVIESASLPSLSVDQLCALMSAAEAGNLLGTSLGLAPAGAASAQGQGTECTYQTGAATASAASSGTYIRVEINRLGFAGQATLINLHRGAHTLRVGGFQAIGADAQQDPSVAEAVLSVKMAQVASDPALWIEAPTSVIARQAAILILPRLAALH
jgi:hypothetical protein